MESREVQPDGSDVGTAPTGVAHAGITAYSAARRASPLSPDKRREMIIAAVIPLLVEHGRAVTTRQIAEEAGIAEGTIFRAFGDKESLIQAAIEHHLDPSLLLAALRAIPPHMELEKKVSLVVQVMRARFTYVFDFMSALGEVGKPPPHPQRHNFLEIVTEILEPDLKRLAMSPERVAQFIRLVTFASAIPSFTESPAFDSDELAELILCGIDRPDQIKD